MVLTHVNCHITHPLHRNMKKSLIVLAAGALCGHAEEAEVVKKKDVDVFKDTAIVQLTEDTFGVCVCVFHL